MPKLKIPNIHPEHETKTPFYRSEPRAAFLMLQNLRPASLFVWGELSPISPEAQRKHLVDVTGTGQLGSGSKKLGRVEKAFVKANHNPQTEKVDECAAITAEWITKEWKRSKDEEEKFKLEWGNKTGAQRQRLDDKWFKEMKAYTRERNLGIEKPKSKI
jgi:hypothetical protein